MMENVNCISLSTKEYSLNNKLAHQPFMRWCFCWEGCAFAVVLAENQLNNLSDIEVTANYYLSRLMIHVEEGFKQSTFFKQDASLPVCNFMWNYKNKNCKMICYLIRLIIHESTCHAESLCTQTYVVFYSFVGSRPYLLLFRKNVIVSID